MEKSKKLVCINIELCQAYNQSLTVFINNHTFFNLKKETFFILTDSKNPLGFEIGKSYDYFELEKNYTLIDHETLSKSFTTKTQQILYLFKDLDFIHFDLAEKLKGLINLRISVIQTWQNNLKKLLTENYHWLSANKQCRNFVQKQIIFRILIKASKPFEEAQVQFKSSIKELHQLYSRLSKDFDLKSYNQILENYNLIYNQINDLIESLKVRKTEIIIAKKIFLENVE